MRAPLHVALAVTLVLRVGAARAEPPPLEPPPALEPPLSALPGELPPEAAPPDPPAPRPDATEPAAERPSHASSPTPAAPTPSPAGPAPAGEKARADADSDIVVSAKLGRGMTVKRRDDRASLTLRSRIQMRNTVKVAEDKTTNEINIKTLRFVLQGHVLSPDIKYSIQLAFGGNDFEPGSATPLFDAWVEYTGLRDANLRAGQFFVPFDRARTIREFALQLVDRPLVVTELTLDRDVGVMVSSADLFGLNEVLAYNLGIFGGEGRNRFGGEKPGFLYVARFAVRPFGAFDDDVEGDVERLSRPRLAVGVAAAYDQATNRQRSTTGATLKTGTLDYQHAAADVVFKYAGLSFLGEALYRRGTPRYREGEIDGEQAREWSRTGFGYLAQIGVMLTDKLEATGRWDQLIALGDTDPALQELVDAQGHEIGAGLNIYLNGHYFKVQADYAHLFGARVGDGMHLARLQLDASF